MRAELCSSPDLAILLWDLEQPLGRLRSLVGALWKYMWPDPVLAYLEGLFLFLLVLVGVPAAGWGLCRSVPEGEWLLSVTALEEKCKQFLLPLGQEVWSMQIPFQLVLLGII